MAFCRAIEFLKTSLAVVSIAVIMYQVMQMYQLRHELFMGVHAVCI
jgi:hypothetical protein